MKSNRFSHRQRAISVCVLLAFALGACEEKKPDRYERAPSGELRDKKTGEYVKEPSAPSKPTGGP